MRRLAWLLVLGVVIQSNGSRTIFATAADEPDAPSAAAQFDKAFGEWKALLSKLRELQIRYQSSKGDERSKLEKNFADMVLEGRKMELKLTDAAEKAYVDNPEKSAQAVEFLVGVSGDNVRRDNFEVSARVAKTLIDKGYNNPALYDVAGIAAFCTNDFANAEKYWDLAGKANIQSALTKKLSPTLKEYKEMWAKEEALRAAEAKADDLPRVKLETTQGPITIELFENEAPNTVANFISLVEKKFYDGLKFHRVLEHFMAQGGDPKGDGTGGPGYRIPCECYLDNHRNHFRGTLSMAHGGRDTGGSQFFLTFLPTPHLNGKHTVFGRVIDGLDVLAKLERIDPSDHVTGVQPDKIVTATVIRKRAHPYDPKKTPGN